jgi:hypothetical protein
VIGKSLEIEGVGVTRWMRWVATEADHGELGVHIQYRGSLPIGERGYFRPVGGVSEGGGHGRRATQTNRWSLGWCATIEDQRSLEKRGASDGFTDLWGV